MILNLITIYKRICLQIKWFEMAKNVVKYVNQNAGEKGMKSKIVMGLMTMMVMSSIAMGVVARIDSQEVVYDSDTKLLWQDNGAVATITKDWQGAMAFCENLNFAGYDDWQLPNLDALKALYSKKNSLRYLAPPRNLLQSYYWSSTTDASGAWVFYFEDGDYRGGDKTKSGGSVRCVRVGQPTDPSIIEFQKQIKDKELKKQAEVNKQQQVRELKESNLNRFRKSIQEGDETSNGLVIQIKGNLVKIQTNDSQCSQRDYDGNCKNWINTPVEKWIKRSEIYPK